MFYSDSFSCVFLPSTSTSIPLAPIVLYVIFFVFFIHVIVCWIQRKRKYLYFARPEGNSHKNGFRHDCSGVPLGFSRYHTPTMFVLRVGSSYTEDSIDTGR